MRKQLQLIMSVLFMVLASLTGYGQNVNGSFDIDGYAYKITSLTPPQVEVVGYTGSGTEATILQTVNRNGTDYQVTAIGNDAFRQKGLTSVTFADQSNVTSIGERAFLVNQLTGVTIPENVTSIGERAFWANLLAEVTIPNSVTSIGRQAFANNKLTQVTLPGSVESIGNEAFVNNELEEVSFSTSKNLTSIEKGVFRNNKLTRVTIPDGVTSIGERAFSQNELTQVTIAGSVTSIGERAFQGNRLTGVEIPEGVTSIGARAFQGNRLTGVEIPESVTIMEQGAFENNALTSVTIPENVTRIERSTFAQNDLREVTIPANVEFIGHHAFFGNNVPGLSLVTVERNDPPMLAANAFQNPGRSQIDVFVPEGGLNAYKEQINGWTGFKSITKIEVGATEEAFSVDHITYKITSASSATVEVVGYDIAGGTSVDILRMVNYQSTNYDVTAIGEEAFKEKGLTSVTFTGSSNVTSIGARAFQGNRLTGVEIPESVTIMEQGAFDKNDLTSVNIPENVTRIEQWTFAQNNLTAVTIPANVEFIGFQAFFRNLNLSIVTVERNPPPTLHETAFELAGYNILGGVDLVVPFGSIQAYEDAGWGLEFGTITSGITTIDGVIYGITTSRNEATVIGNTGTPDNLTIPTTVDIRGNNYPVTAIGDHALQSAGNLLQVIIPESVTSIDSVAFKDNPNLSIVTVERNDPPSIHAYAFQNPGRDQIDLVVPPGREQVYIDGGWTGFRSISSRISTDDGYAYKITSLTPPQVELAGYTGAAKEATILQTLNYQGTNYDVTAIGEEAFKEKQLTGVTFTGSSNVTSIGARAFAYNKLTQVTLPGSVESIGQDAFKASELEEVTFSTSGNLTSIGEWAFQGNRLTGVEIPESVTIIGQGAFDKNDLTSVNIPENVTRIEQWTFGQNDLTTVTIPAKVEFIGFQAFFRNQNLSIVTVEAIDPPSLAANAFQKNTFQNTGREQIDLVVPPGRKQVYIDGGWKGFKSISSGTFADDGINYEITSLTPNEVKVVDYIGSATAIEIPETVDDNDKTYTVTAIEVSAFRDNKLTSVTIPDGVTSIGIGTFRNNHLTRVSVSSTVTSIGSNAFRNNRLTSVVIPDGVTSIGSNAFEGNPNLVLVTVEATHPPSLVAANAFTNRSLIDLIIPRGTLGAYQNPTNGWTGFNTIAEEVAEGDNFTVDGITYEVTLLGSPNNVTITDNTNTGVLTIPHTVTHGGNDFEVTSIGANAFENSALTSVVIPDGVTSIGAEAFVNNELESVAIPSGVTTIESDAFRGNKLTSVVIPDGVTRIGNIAFYGNDLTSVVIPDGVTYIGNAAFYGNDLTSVFIPDGVTYIYIGDAAFYGNALTSVVIPYGVTNIGNSTFRNNHLTGVTLSSTVISIATGAFRGNPDLALVTVEANHPPWLHENAFADRGQIDLIVPIGQRQAYLDNGWDGFRSITEESLVLTVGSNIEFRDFTLYPNPTRDKVHIDIDPRSGQALKQVNIYTMTGAYLYSENEREINTGRLSEGMYLFEIVTKTGDRSMRRVIIQ